MNRWRNCSTAFSCDGQRANIPHNYRGRASFISVSFFGRRGRGNQRQLTLTILHLWKIHEGVEYFKPNPSQLESTWEILKMNPTLRYFVSLTLKLVSNQLHTSSSNWYQGSHSKLKGTMIRVHVENNFDRDSVCHMAIKVFRSTFTTAMCKSTIITLLDDSNLNAFQTFWPRLNTFVW